MSSKMISFLHWPSSYIQLLVLSLRILLKLNIGQRTHHLQSLKIVAWCLRTHYLVSVTVVHHPKEIRQISQNKLGLQHSLLQELINFLVTKLGIMNEESVQVQNKLLNFLRTNSIIEKGWLVGQNARNKPQLIQCFPYDKPALLTH